MAVSHVLTALPRLTEPRVGREAGATHSPSHACSPWKESREQLGSPSWVLGSSFCLGGASREGPGDTPGEGSGSFVLSPDLASKLQDDLTFPLVRWKFCQIK